jgi:hypothetical protein
MTTEARFHAEKPALTTHPAGGGDALVFPITPSPPRWWWRAMRHRAGAAPALIRPWDQERESRIAVTCTSLDSVGQIIDAIEAAVRQTNQDYEQELDRRRGASERLKTVEAERVSYLSDVGRAIDERYPSPMSVPDRADGNGDNPSQTMSPAARVTDNLTVLEDDPTLVSMIRVE